MLSVTDTRYVQRGNRQLHDIGPPGPEDGHGHAGKGLRRKRGRSWADVALGSGVALPAPQLSEIAAGP